MAVAVVTGSNQGIGFGIVRGLCKQFQGTVYLTARCEDQGLEAVKQLQSEGLNPAFHQLDISDEESRLRFRDALKCKHDGIGILVNNAGVSTKQDSSLCRSITLRGYQIAEGADYSGEGIEAVVNDPGVVFQEDPTDPFGPQATWTLKTNYWDTKRTCEVLFPLLTPGARVVNVSSMMAYLGWLARGTNKEKALEIKQKLASDNLTESQLDELMSEFETSANDGTYKEKGWIPSTYSVSKMGLSALSRIQHRQFQQDDRKDIVVNHVHPGYVDTEMAGHKVPLTIDHGANSSIYAALLPANTNIRGNFIWDNKESVDWVKGPLPAFT